MANQQGRIKLGIDVAVNKAGFNTAKTALQELIQIGQNMSIGGNAKNELNDLTRMAQQVESAMEQAFNVNLGTVNLNKFNQILAKSNLNIKDLGAEASKAGQQGQMAFQKMATQLLTTNTNIKKSHEMLDKMAYTLGNTIRWSIASAAINAITGSIQKAYTYSVDLDTSLTNIRIVTEKSADEMERFAVSANKAAKELGASTKSYADAALIYYQQGLSDEEVAARSSVTVKAANVTGQSAQQVSEQLTAVWNGYKVSAAESEKYIDKLAAVAASTAADLEELSVGMSRVASAANIMGVDVDQLNAQLATIVSVTREAPESIGTALKTVYARMSDLEAGTDAETTLGEYTKQMAQFGINALDANGKLRDMGAVVEEIGNKWEFLSRNQQVALAQTIAGTRQYSRMMSLFDNWDMYQEALTTSQNSVGTLQKQQDIYMESTEAHLKRLTAASEELYSHLFNTDNVEEIVDMLIKLVEGADNLVGALGGGVGVLQTLGVLALNLFGNHMAKGMATMIKNMQLSLTLSSQMRAEQQLLTQLGETDITKVDSRIIEIKKEQLKYAKLLSQEEYDAINRQIRGIDELTRKEIEYREQKNRKEDLFKRWNPDNAKFKTTNLGADATSYMQNYEALQQSANEAVLNYDSSSLITLTQRLKEADISMDEFNLSVQNSINSYPQLIADTQQVLQMLPQESAAYQELKGALDAAELETGENSQRNAELAIALDRVRERLLETGKNAYDTAKDIEHLANKEKECAEGAERLNKQTQGTFKGLNLDHAISQFTSIAGKISSVAMGLNMLSNLGDIWKNEDLDAGEKFLQIIMNLSMGLPMIGMAIPGLIKAFQPLSAFFKTEIKTISAYTAAKNALNAMNKKQAALQAQLTRQTTAEAALKKLLNNEEITQAEKALVVETLQTRSADLLNNRERALIQTRLAGLAPATSEIKANQDNAIAKLASSVAADKNATSTTVEAGAKAINKKKTDVETASIWANVAAKMAQYWWVGLIVAGVAALTAAIWLGVKAYNADAEAAKKTAEAAEKLKESYEAVKQANEELKQSLADYSEAQTALDEMTQGTKEWEEALRNANMQVLELLQNYPELAKYIKRDPENQNRLMITDEGLDYIAEASLQAERLAYSTSLSGEIAAQKASTRSKLTNLARTEGIYTTSTAVSGEQLQGILEIINQEGIDILEKPIEELQKILETNDRTLVMSLKRNADAIAQAAVSLDATQQSLELLRIESIAAQVEAWDNLAYEHTEYQVAVNAVIASKITKEVVDEYAKNYDGKTDAQKQQAYVDYMVNTGQWKSATSDNKTGNKGEYSYVTKSGETGSVTLDDALVVQVLAEYEALQAQGLNLTEIVNAVETVAGQWRGDNVAELQAAAIGFAGKQGGKADLSKLTRNEIAQLKKALEELDATTLKLLGYDSLDEFTKTFNASTEAYNTAMDTAGNELSTTAKRYYNQIRLVTDGKLNLDQAEKLADLYKNVFNASGVSGLETLEKTFIDAGDSAGELIDVLTKSESTLDWTSVNIKADFIDALDEAKIASGNFNVDKLIAEMQRAQNAANQFNLSNAEETYSAIYTILDALSSWGSTISSEDYTTLTKNLPRDIIENYFTKMANGSYILTKSAEEFNQVINQLVAEDPFNKLQTEIQNTQGLFQAKALFNENTPDIKLQESTGTPLEDMAYNQAYIEKFKELAEKYGLSDKLGSEWKGVSIGQSGAMTYEMVSDWLEQTSAGQDLLEEWNGDKEKVIGYIFQNGTQAFESQGISEWLSSMINTEEVRDNATAPIKYQSNYNTVSSLLNSLALLSTLSDNALTNSGIDRAMLDQWQTDIASMMSDEKLTDEEFKKLSTIANIVNNVEIGDIETDSITEGVIWKLKTARSQDELDAMIPEVKAALGYDRLAPEIQAAIDEAIADTDGGIAAAVKKNEREDTTARWESQVEAMQKVNEEYENMNSLLDSQISLIQLMEGENAYASIEASLQAQTEASKAIMDSNKQQMEYWKQQMEDNINDPVLWEQAKENYQEAAEAYYNSMSSYIEKLQEKEINAINAAFAEREKLMTETSLVNTSEDWELKKAFDDEYLDEVNRAYRTQDLARKFKTAMNNTTDVNLQAKIRKLMDEQLAILENQDKLSEYDLTRAEKKLEVLEKENALLDARNAKTQMQLVRGPGGTYSYEYVADAENMLKAEEELAAAQNELYNLDLEEYKSTLDKAYSYYTEFKEKWIEAAQIANEEERKARQDMLKETYLGEDGLITELIGADGFGLVANNLKTTVEELGGVFDDSRFGEMKDLVLGLQSFMSGASKEDSNLYNLLIDVEKVESAFAAANKSLEGWQESLEKGVQNAEAIVEITRDATYENNDLELYNGIWDSEALRDAITGAFTNALNNVSMTWNEQDGKFEWASGETGLYTGEWGKEGKFLMAHEKELLLNKSDTENILNAVSFVRSLNALTLERIAAMGGIQQPNSVNTLMPGTEGIEQKVEITANFPNVSVKEEIEAAFDDIINLATQFAFKKR